MRVLVINSGSSSIKYRILDLRDYSVLASGVLEQIGEPRSRLRYSWLGKEGTREEAVQEESVPGHQRGFELIIAAASDSGALRDAGDLFVIGHRVVHGGETFHEPVVINKKVVNTIREMIPLAPLHNPANLTGIEVALKLFPGVPQVAVFDTAFHQTMPPHAFHYALPYDLYKSHHIRRYGFHGMSHRYVAGQAAKYLRMPLSDLNLITIHLGNGASATAIRAGESIDTTMGMTPLEGLMMGTRCGDLDPAIHFYLEKTLGKSTGEIERLLRRESGLKGICGANDMRDVQRLAREGDKLAQLAIDMYCYRVKKYIGAYLAVLGRVDAVVFTGGIGENSALIRRRSCEDLDGIGIIMEERKNEAPFAEIAEIQSEQSKVKVLVVRTDEELEIARQAVQCIRTANVRHSII